MGLVIVDFNCLGHIYCTVLSLEKPLYNVNYVWCLADLFIGVLLNTLVSLKEFCYAAVPMFLDFVVNQFPFIILTGVSHCP